MKANVGGMDRILRVLVGIALLSQVFVGLQTPWGWIGVIPLLTGVFRFCPFYPLLGLNSCSREAV
ncbi:MAG: DUF2892 domain-containing protein [Magnetococcales bacterium]|nr:DUF2892 domain-containing protein [Magnetococcales bacterium]